VKLPLLLSLIPGGIVLHTLMERRRTERLKLAIPLRVSVLNSAAPGHGTESVNVSAGGMYFATNLPLSRGTGVRLFFKMPEEITHTPASDWVCMGHVVHVRPIGAPDGWLGVGVQFDCYEVVPTAKSFGGFNPFPKDDLVVR
jgi:PilZ domain